MKKTITILSVSMGMLFSAAPFAAETEDAVMIDAGPCLDLTRPIERLTCFEDQLEAARNPDAAAVARRDLPVVSIPRNTAAQPVPQDRPESGSESPQVAENASANSGNSFEENFGISTDDDGKDRELVARVAEIKELNPNRKLITLENGQVWEQKDTKRFALAADDEIRIYPTRWGSSYRLASRSHSGFITVQRLR